MGRVFVAAAAIFAVRLATAPPDVETIDGLHFVRGVTRYSVAEQRPHWPGYPVYIAAGQVLHAAGLPPVWALKALSAAGWTACLLLIGALVGTRAGAVAAAAIWGLAPAAWFAGQMVLSDVPALALALGTLWLVVRADDAADARPAAGALLAGLTAGTRLPYVALLLPWGIRFVSRRRAVVVLALCVTAWLGWQLAHDPGYLAYASARLYAHLGNWHHRVWSQLGPRLLAFAETFVVHGLGGWWPGAPLVRIPATFLLLFAFGRGVSALRSDNRRAWLLALWTVPYLLLVLAANDPRVARYGLPVTAAVAVVAGLGVARLPRPWAASLAIVLAGVAVLAPLERQARREPPLPVQVAAYVAAHLDPRTDVVFVTDDAAFVRGFLEEAGAAVETAGQDVLLARARASSAAGRTVYATAPSQHAPERWTLAERFRRHRRLESRGPWDVSLYRYVPPAVSATSGR